MPKLPRISGSQCVAALERLGFVVMRRGDRGCVVPLHRELKIGTLHGLLKQGGVAVDDFFDILQW